MICENAYYQNGTGENRARLFCRKGVPEFNGKCPFVYWCQVDEKYENTVDMFDCINREENK